MANNAWNRIPVPLICGCLVAATCLLVFLGWQLDAETFRSLTPGQPSTTPLTALMLLGLSVSLVVAWLIERGVLPSRYLPVCWVLSGMVGALAIWTLTQYLFHLSPSFEVSLFHDLVVREGGRFPGRPSPRTSATALLLGIAIALATFSSPKYRRAAMLSGLAAGIFPWLAVFGYATLVRTLYSVTGNPQTGISLITALSFLMVLAGTFSLMPREWPGALLTSPTSGGLLGRKLLPVAAGVPLLLGWASVSAQQAGLLETSPLIALNWGITSLFLVGLILWGGSILKRRDEELLSKQRQLEEHHNRLATLVDTSPVGVLLAEAETDQILLMNSEARRIFGAYYQENADIEWYQGTTTYLRPDGTLYQPEERPLVRALRTGETVRAEEIRLEFPDGRSIPTLVDAAPIYSDSGQISAAIKVIQDITPLQELDKLRSEFLGMVTHEMRTPLTVIKGPASTVLESRRPLTIDEFLEFFRIIDEEADRLKSIVDNLLDMSRIKSGSLAVVVEAVDPRHIIEDARSSFLRTNSQREVSLLVADDAPRVSADPQRIIQVLVNLLNNADKLSPPSAAIDLAASFDSVHLTVSVLDRGRGIPSEDLAHIFEKFYQVQDDSGAGPAGSGLGLAISQGIIESHGGRIWAESDGDGTGTVVRFTLPIHHDREEIPELDTTRRANGQGRVSRPGERTRVLAVDDDLSTLRYLERVLNESGYRAIGTSNAQEVIPLVESEAPDLVLLDLMMPGVSGFGLLENLRAISGVPVIFVTGRDQPEDAVRGLRLGADDYITKPFSQSELLARVEAVLRRRIMSDRIEVGPPIVLDDLAISPADRKVTVKGQGISLSATEYKVRYELATHSGIVLTHDQILQRVWGDEYFGETELVRSMIRNLRRKLGDNARNPHYTLPSPR